MPTLAQRLADSPSRRDPPYRPVMTMGDDDRTLLEERIGSAQNYNPEMLRRLVAADPTNLELRKALVSTIMSAEFAGVDAFSRKVVEWQDWPVPDTLILAMARQTWDEVRHAKLATGVLESYGGYIGEYPDTLAGGAPPPGISGEGNGGPPPGITQDPVIMLSAVNVSLEGGALTLFKQTSELGERIGDDLLERCYDYNWADEVTHTMIGDYFVKQLCEENPESEQRALRAHAMFEYQRARLSGDQTQELREFFAEEMQRASAALGGEGYQ
jgi:hypothetical protein